MNNIKERPMARKRVEELMDKNQWTIASLLSMYRCGKLPLSQKNYLQARKMYHEVYHREYRYV